MIRGLDDQEVEALGKPRASGDDPGAPALVVEVDA